jgi:hypothetical protein
MEFDSDSGFTGADCEGRPVLTRAELVEGLADLEALKALTLRWNPGWRIARDILPDELPMKACGLSLLDIAAGLVVRDAFRFLIAFHEQQPTSLTMQSAIAGGDAEMIVSVWDRLSEGDRSKVNNFAETALTFRQYRALGWLAQRASVSELIKMLVTIADMRLPGAVLSLLEAGIELDGPIGCPLVSKWVELRAALPEIGGRIERIVASGGRRGGLLLKLVPALIELGFPVDSLSRVKIVRGKGFDTLCGQSPILVLFKAFEGEIGAIFTTACWSKRESAFGRVEICGIEPKMFKVVGEGRVLAGRSCRSSAGKTRRCKEGQHILRLSWRFGGKGGAEVDLINEGKRGFRLCYPNPQRLTPDQRVRLGWLGGHVEFWKLS